MSDDIFTTENSCSSNDSAPSTSQNTESESQQQQQSSSSVKECIEQNRQKALKLRAAKRSIQDSGPGAKIVPVKVSHVETTRTRLIDTGAGFLLEEPVAGKSALHTTVVHEPGAILDDDRLICEDCGKEFLDSFLMDKFHKPVCNNCKEMDDNKYKLITKTEAKSKYQLKDVDLDKREPPLHYIVKKNPRHEKWGEMKLYLESQVAARALEVFGSEDQMEKERLKKVEKREKMQQKKFDKNVQALRMALQSTQPTKSHKVHKHDFGPDVYDSESDQYTKTCQTCGHSLTFEKM